MSAPTWAQAPSLAAGLPLGDAVTDGPAQPGPVPWRGGPGVLTEEVAAAGLTGRGGAGFPVARKLAAVTAAAARTGRSPVVVANGAEGEPASGKDAFLLTSAPHLVLDGLVLAAEAVGADRALMWVQPQHAERLRAAIAARASDRVPIVVREAPDHFLAGEETAAVAGLDGRPVRPADKARRVAESGVGGRPTLVQNVETLAHLALIARHGPDRFRDRGTRAEPGTMLVTVSGGSAGRQVREVELGARLPAVLDEAGVADPAAVLVGGFHGAWLAAPEVAAARLSRASLAAWGATPGAGVLAALPAGASGLTESARIGAYLAAASARQCLACVNGLPAMADVLARLAAGDRSPGLVASGRRLAALVTGRGACRHPDGTARLVTSALRVFAEEWT